MKLQEWVSQQRGRQAALAVQLRLKQPQVAAWLSGKKRVPLDHCPYIEQFTGGSVTCEELRPDQASYFALIRELAGQTREAVSTAAVTVTVPGYTGTDRRAPGPGRDAGTDMDRRAPAGG